MLSGRLGLERSRIPHADRHGLIWLERGRLFVEDGCLRFSVVLDGEIQIDTIPFQAISAVLLGPGGTVTHDALRLMARHGTALLAIGQGGVRCYTSAPIGPDSSDVARQQVKLWADPKGRLTVARRMYALRMGEVLPHRDLEVLRGIEGARAKAMYQLMAQRHGVPWSSRRYDRENPDAADIPNQAINHVSSAVVAAATIAVYSVGAIPQLGFIHEASGSAFILDVADLFRDTVTLPVAFACAAMTKKTGDSVDRLARKNSSLAFERQQLIPKMIDQIKSVLAD